MNSLLIHGCYDSVTLKTLKQLGVKEFAFDLRPKSFNLISFKDLLLLLDELKDRRVFLTFENERPETIVSALDLVGKKPSSFTVILRDYRPGEYYRSLDFSFFWMFHPAADYRSILEAKNLQGVILPLKWQDEYLKHPDLWQIIERKNLEVYLHAESFDDVLNLDFNQDLNFSLDLGSEIESEYRKVDQEKLTGMKIWRKLNESTALKR